MKLLAIAYPELSDKDFHLIEHYRKDHDKMFAMVRPHFTFVFPVNDFSVSDFSIEIKKQVEGVKSISFCLRSSLVIKDDFNEYYHAFLIPEEGFNEIIKLHVKLYSGALSKHHRTDIDFIPHITVGNSTDEIVCKKMVDEWNTKGFAIRGIISLVDIIVFENERIETIGKIKLTTYTDENN